MEIGEGPVCPKSFPAGESGRAAPQLCGVPQLEVHVVAQDPPLVDPPKAEAAPAEKDEGKK